MRNVLVSGMIALTILPSVASARTDADRDNGSFFNKPGASAEQVAGDTSQCRAIAEGADSQITGVNVAAGGLGAIIGGAFAGKRLRRVNIENCMLIRGWRLYAMTREEGASWKALSESERDKELATLVGAEAPARGTLLREWRNDYAEPALWQKN